MKLFDLSGRVALVTGGNSGIGLGMAEGLAAAGAGVMIAGRNRAKNAAALERLKSLTKDVDVVEADVTRQTECQAMVQRTLERFGSLTVLANNAGTNIRKRPEELSLTEWQSILDTNLTSAFMVSQAAYPAMQRAGFGKIINTGSMMSIFGTGFHAAYAASKGGIVQLTKALAAGWARDRIQVNAILPGWIDTELTRAARRDLHGLHERVLARTPAGRWGTPEDLAGIAVFLCSPASDFITGTAIPVDGGYSVLG